MKRENDPLMRRPVGLLLSACLLIGLAGCGDRYSQKRIRLRQLYSSTLTDGIARSETRRRQRLVEAQQTLKRWWRRDSERFRRRAPTVGDYFW